MSSFEVVSRGRERLPAAQGNFARLGSGAGGNALLRAPMRVGMRQKAGHGKEAPAVEGCEGSPVSPQSSPAHLCPGRPRPEPPPCPIRWH